MCPRSSVGIIALTVVGMAGATTLPSHAADLDIDFSRPWPTPASPDHLRGEDYPGPSRNSASPSVIERSPPVTRQPNAIARPVKPLNQEARGAAESSTPRAGPRRAPPESSGGQRGGDARSATTTGAVPPAIGPESSWNWSSRLAWLLILGGLAAAVLLVLALIDDVFDRSVDPMNPSTTPDIEEDLLSEVFSSQPGEPDLSAADIREQTAILRAMKDHVDAQLAAAQTTINRERTKQGEKPS
jgi:hypothetical protein